MLDKIVTICYNVNQKGGVKVADDITDWIMKIVAYVTFIEYVIKAALYIRGNFKIRKPRKRRKLK